VTTFAQQDQAGGKVRLMIAADVGEPDAKPGTYTVGYILVDQDGKVASSFGGTRPLASGGPNAPLQLDASMVVDPGVYELRIAAIDAEGRRGSVVREVSAWKMAGEPLATGDLIVGSMPQPGQSMRPVIEPRVTTDAMAAYLELYSNAATTFDGATVRFEVAEDADAPPLVTQDGRLASGAQPTWRVAEAGISARELPAGRYVARARVLKGGNTITVLSRPFILERTTPMRAAIAPVIPAFDRGAVLQAAFLSSMFDSIEKRAPALKAVMAQARAGRYGPAALDALASGDQTVAAFLKGVELFSKGQLNEAATQLQSAAGPRREFFPAAFYLGACFAAAGRDRDAAGVWQMALGDEARAPEIYVMVADARLRDRQLESAIEILKSGYERTGHHAQVAHRLGLIYALMGRHDEALPLLDVHLAKEPGDQEALLAAIVSQYEVAKAGRALSNTDRAKVRGYASAYNGPQRALVARYLDELNR
jgi:tetratricopeptide (TPR) repeat protein